MIELRLDGGMFGVDLSEFQKYTITLDSAKWLVNDGPNYYKMLAYFSHQLPKYSCVADLGTMVGNSAIALASNPDVTVYTYDIEDKVGNLGYKGLKNVHFYPGNCIHYVDRYIDFPFVYLDIDPHDGAQEKQLYDILLARRFRGILVCDDIHYGPGMKAFWDSIKIKKYDVTHYGHTESGTGIVVFEPTVIDVTVV